MCLYPTMEGFDIIQTEHFHPMLPILIELIL